MNTSPKTESVIVSLPKEEINLDLASISPCVEVVGSRLIEEGWELILEGPSNQIDELITFWVTEQTICLGKRNLPLSQ